MNNRISYILIIICLCYSCNVKKFIPENELLYTGAEIEIDSDTLIEQKEELMTELKSVIKPSPNSKFLGMRPGLYFHYKAQREKPGFINKFLNKNIGEEPVYLSDIEITNTEEHLLNRLENRGLPGGHRIGTVNGQHFQSISAVPAAFQGAGVVTTEVTWSRLWRSRIRPPMRRELAGSSPVVGSS